MGGRYCFAGQAGGYCRSPVGLGASLSAIKLSSRCAGYKGRHHPRGSRGFPFLQVTRSKTETLLSHNKGAYIEDVIMFGTLGSGSKKESSSMGAGIVFWASFKSKAMKALCGAHLCYNPL